MMYSHIKDLKGAQQRVEIGWVCILWLLRHMVHGIKATCELLCQYGV